MLQIRKAILALTMIACASMNAMQLTHKGNDFFVDNTKIERAFIDKELRGIDNVKLAKLAAAGATLKLAKLNNSEDYALHLGAPLNGGGALGATIGFWTGKILVHGTAQILMHVAALATGPAYPVTLATLQTTLLVPVEAASNTVGLGLGILGGVATGPA